MSNYLSEAYYNAIEHGKYIKEHTDFATEYKDPSDNPQGKKNYLKLTENKQKQLAAIADALWDHSVDDMFKEIFDDDIAPFVKSSAYEFTYNYAMIGEIGAYCNYKIPGIEEEKTEDYFKDCLSEMSLLENSLYEYLKEKDVINEDGLINGESPIDLLKRYEDGITLSSETMLLFYINHGDELIKAHEGQQRENLEQEKRLFNEEEQLHKPEEVLRKEIMDTIDTDEKSPALLGISKDGQKVYIYNDEFYNIFEKNDPDLKVKDVVEAIGKFDIEKTADGSQEEQSEGIIDLDRIVGKERKMMFFKDPYNTRKDGGKIEDYTRQLVLKGGTEPTDVWVREGIDLEEDSEVPAPQDTTRIALEMTKDTADGYRLTFASYGNSLKKDTYSLRVADKEEIDWDLSNKYQIAKELDIVISKTSKIAGDEKLAIKDCYSRLNTLQSEMKQLQERTIRKIIDEKIREPQERDIVAEKINIDNDKNAVKTENIKDKEKESPAKKVFIPTYVSDQNTTDSLLSQQKAIDAGGGGDIWYAIHAELEGREIRQDVIEESPDRVDDIPVLANKYAETDTIEEREDLGFIDYDRNDKYAETDTIEEREDLRSKDFAYEDPDDRIERAQIEHEKKREDVILSSKSTKETDKEIDDEHYVRVRHNEYQ